MSTESPLGLETGLGRDNLSAEKRAPGVAGYLVWAPIVVFAIGAVIVGALNPSGVHRSDALFASLNTLFLTSAGLLIAYLAGRTHLTNGSRAVLAFGSGALAFGLASLSSGLVVGEPNRAITVSNSGLILAGASFALSAYWALAGRPGQTQPRPSPRRVTLAYLGVLAFVAAWTTGALAGITPKFYIASQGATTVRLVILWLAVVGFVGAAVVFGLLYRRRGTWFLVLCCGGLGVLGLGLATVAGGSTFGSPLNWLGRSGQYLGACYLILAILSVPRDRGAWLLPLERALRETEDRYQQLVDLSPDAILVNVGGKRAFANPAAAKLFGADSPQELIGRTALDMVHPHDRERVARRNALVLAGGQPPIQEIRILRLDGTAVEVEAIGALIEFDGVPAVQVILRDITEHKRAEAALRRSEEQLRQSQKMEAVGQLAGGIAHDFNNLLTAILGYSELLLAREEGFDPSVTEDLKEIKQAAKRASALTSQILAFSRRQALQPQVVSLNEVLSRMKSLLRRTLGEDIDLVSRQDRDLGNVEVDVHQFEQVLMNLALNARDAMTAGGRLTLETGNVQLDAEYCLTHPEVTPGSYVMLAVSDTGAGMDEVTRERIFEPFFTTKAPGAGTGLGLAMVYGTVKQSGGSISVYSEPGRGTSFKIYLPRVTAAKEEIPVDPERASAGGAETILVVEDEASVRSLAERILVEQGYRVLSAATAEEALQVAAEAGYRLDLLLTDVTLPGAVQGSDLALELIKRLPDLPLLYMSGYARNAIVHAGRVDEGVNFLEKPFTPETLAGMVRRVLDQARSR